MRNIIKSQTYGIRHDIFTYIGVAVAVIFLISEVIMSLDTADGVTASGSIIFGTGGENTGIGLFFIASLVTARVFGFDFDDRTINYEVLYGHGRSKIYWSRTLTAFVLSIISGIIFTLIPTLVFTVINGWGYALSVKEFAVRCVTAVFPMLRISAVAVFITVILRKSWATGIICCMILETEAIISEIVDVKPYFMSFTNIMQVFTFANMSYGFENGEDVIIMKDTLSGQFIVATVVVSIVISAVLLFSGYLIFRRRDMN